MTIEFGESLGPGARRGRHAPLPWFDVRDDQVVLGGRTLSELARQVGRTPFYAYDRAVIDRKLGQLRAALPAGMHVRYAVKANPLPEIIAYLSARTDGLDVASAGELRAALAAHCAADRISFAGPGKTADELRLAVEQGILINVESERELQTLCAMARARSKRPRIALRINPDFELKASGMKMGGGSKPFGVDAEQAPALLRSLHGLPVEFVGLHIFSGSQSLQAQAVIEAQASAVALAVRLAKDAPAPMRELNLGGGFGVPYFPGERPLELAPIAQNLATLAQTCGHTLPQARLILELGRYLVGESGLYVCRVLDRKVSRGQTFLIVDGGLHHHLAASGNFGQVIRRNFPVFVGNRVRGGEREVVNVTGPLCTPLDILAEQMEMARADVGDLIVVAQSGAYGLSASPVGFLQHPLPAEIFV